MNDQANQRYARIAGTGSYLPERILTNYDIEKLVATSHDWIVTRTGIQERRIASQNETSASMGAVAAQRALATAEVDPKVIDLIIVATSTPDKAFPSTACMIQQRLNLSSCPAFDVSAACAGFNYAFSVASQFIQTGQARNVLVVGAEVMSRILDWSDRSTCILFADGAGAVVLQASEQPGVISTQIHADGQYGHLLYTTPHIPRDDADNLDDEGNHRPYMVMKGNEVFKVAVNKLNETVVNILRANDMQKTDLHWLIPHQANLRIIRSVAKKLELPMEQVVVTIDKQGNTSAASVPLALDEAIRDGRIQRGHNILLESFGGGFTWGAALVCY